MNKLFTHQHEGLTVTGNLSPDEMKLFLDGVCNPQRKVDLEELVAIVSQHTSLDLIHLEVLQDISLHLSKGEEIKERRVAKGIPPEPGHDGKIVFLVRRVVTKNGKIQVKQHSTNLDLENIQTGRPLARVYKPKAGTPGKSAAGKSLPAVAGRPIEVKLNPTIGIQRVDEHYDHIVAAKNGYLSEEAGALSVLEEMVFDGDFDHRFGSVDFNGVIHVCGEVKPDSFLSGVQGVIIDGSVNSGVVVRSKSGNISIKGAINGGKTAKFQCSGQFECTALQQAEVNAGGSIRIAREAHSCEVRTQGFIDASGSQLFGGEFYSAEGIVVAKLGNTAGVQTKIFLCADVETQKEYQDLVSRIESHEKAAHLLELHLGPMAQHPDRIVLLQPDHRTRIEGLLKKFREVKKSNETLIAQRDQMLLTSQRKDELAISVEKIAYPGAEVFANTLHWKFLEEKKGPFGLHLRKGAEALEMGDFVPPPSDKSNTKSESKGVKRDNK